MDFFEPASVIDEKSWNSGSPLQAIAWRGAGGEVTFRFGEMGNIVKRFAGPVLLISLLLLMVNQATAHTEKAFYLKGKLGVITIAVKMLCYDETPTIRYVQYFFSNDKRDRYMAGKLVDGLWWFAADVQPIEHYPKPEGSLSIAPNGTNWQGSWTDNSGRKQAVLLTPIEDAPQFLHLPQISEMDPYERFRLSMLHFVKTTTQKRMNGLQTDWYLEKESGTTFFRISTNRKEINTGYINAALEAIHLSLLQQYFAYAPQKTYAKPETQLLYLTKELVSFRTTVANRLLTLTTTRVQLAATLNMGTGATLKLEELIWLDKATEKPAAGDFFDLYQYRKKVFAPNIFQWLQQLYPQKIQTESCGINKVESWNLPIWNLTNTGLALGINKTDECNTLQWAIIPYKLLQPFITQPYHLP